jgi:hypothetical protein
MNRWKTTGAALIAAAGLAASLPKPAAAGAVGGPKIARTSARARGVDRFSCSFRAGRPARVWATGNGDIDLKVYDEYGHLIASDTARDGAPGVGWTPRWTGRFTIRVINNERYRVHYVLRTN